MVSCYLITVFCVQYIDHRETFFKMFISLTNDVSEIYSGIFITHLLLLVHVETGCGGPADKASWLIQMICNPLLQFVKAHLRSTQHLLNNLRSIKNGELKNKLLFSLDVVSLYPSVDNDAAIDTYVYI